MTALVLSLLFFLLLFFSAIFSASETALFSLSKARLLSWAGDTSSARRNAALLMRSYNRTIIVLVLGNMFVNSGLSLCSNEFFSLFNMPPAASVAVSILTAVVLLLLFGEVTPKSIALAKAESFSQLIANPTLILSKILHPLIVVLEKAFAVVLDVLGRRTSAPLSPDEYTTYLDMGMSIGAFSANETSMFGNILSMRKARASSVMRPRVDLKCIRSNSSPAMVAATIKKTRELFYPVVSNDLDDAVSFVSAKDFYLLPAEDRDKWLENATFKAQFVPENALLTMALSEMLAAKVPAALVVDEFGGITGCVTLRNIYEKLVGGIKNEFEIQEGHIEKTGDGSWIVSGNAPLKEISAATGMSFPATPANTLNGLFYELNESIPLTGDELELEKAKVLVQEVQGNRILKAELMLANDAVTRSSHK